MIHNKKIKVLHLIDSAGFGGGERYVMDIIRFSSSKFSHFVVLPNEGPFEELLKDQGFNYRIISLEYLQLFHSIFLLIELAKKHHINIIHTHGYRANFFGRVAGLLSNKIVVSTLHVSLYDYVDTPDVIRKLYITFEKLFSFKTKIFICISESIKEDAIRMGIPSHRIHLIPNGVDLNKFYPRDKKKCRIEFSKRFGIKITDTDLIIGTVGRMVTEKGQIYLLDAMRYLKDIFPKMICLLVGSGPLLPYLKKKAKELGLNKRCIFIKPFRDIELFYPLLDIFVLPSIREPFGLVLLEAMASGIPVIATSSGGPLDIIRNGQNGLLATSEDSKSLADKISELLSDSKKRTRIALEGLNSVKERYDIQKTVMNIEEIYKTAILERY